MEEEKDEGTVYEMKEVQNTLCKHDYALKSEDGRWKVWQCSKCGSGYSESKA